MTAASTTRRAPRPAAPRPGRGGGAATSPGLEHLAVTTSVVGAPPLAGPAAGPCPGRLSAHVDGSGPASATSGAAAPCLVGLHLAARRAAPPGARCGRSATCRGRLGRARCVAAGRRGARAAHRRRRPPRRRGSRPEPRPDLMITARVVLDHGGDVARSGRRRCTSTARRSTTGSTGSRKLTGVDLRDGRGPASTCSSPSGWPPTGSRIARNSLTHRPPSTLSKARARLSALAPKSARPHCRPTRREHPRREVPRCESSHGRCCSATSSSSAPAPSARAAPSTWHGQGCPSSSSTSSTARPRAARAARSPRSARSGRTTSTSRCPGAASRPVRDFPAEHGIDVGYLPSGYLFARPRGGVAGPLDGGRAAARSRCSGRRPRRRRGAGDHPVRHRRRRTAPPGGRRTAS